MGLQGFLRRSRGFQENSKGISGSLRKIQRLSWALNWISGVFRGIPRSSKGIRGFPERFTSFNMVQWRFKAKWSPKLRGFQSRSREFRMVSGELNGERHDLATFQGDPKGFQGRSRVCFSDITCNPESAWTPSENSLKLSWNYPKSSQNPLKQFCRNSSHFCAQ